MSTQTKPTPEITRAAERYLEQYGDPLVMNTYLKVTILVLAVVCLALAGLIFKSQKALAIHAADDHPYQRRGPRRSDRLSQLPVPAAGGGEQVLSHALGGACISAAIASPSSATRPVRSISSTATCSAR